MPFSSALLILASIGLTVEQLRTTDGFREKIAFDDTSPSRKLLTRKSPLAGKARRMSWQWNGSVRGTAEPERCRTHKG